MATLIQLREYVRRQTETTDAELPNETIDGYLREAFNRTINRLNRWPFYETRWVLTVPAGPPQIALPADVNAKTIVSLVAETNTARYRLQMIDHETAEDLYLGSLSPKYGYGEYSIWGNVLYLWPASELVVNTDFILRANRLARDWVADGDASVVDADERLHWPLTHYAIALAYAQQEDEVLETTYMTRWQNDVDVAVSSIMEPGHDVPLTMGGGKRTMGSTAPVSGSSTGWSWGELPA